MNAHITINGQEFPVHSQLLLAIAKNLPAKEHYKPLAWAIIALGMPSITAGLIKSSGALLDQEDLDKLWDAGDPNIRKSLLAKPEFVAQLTEAQARDILDADDPDMLKSIAERPELLYPCHWGRHGTRLSGAMADALLEYVAGSRYPKVRQTLAEDYGTPRKFFPAFRECVESGLSVKGVIFAIQPEDIELLNTASVETLHHVAYKVDSIANDAALRGVIHLLCSHPDPSVRLELANNSQAPKPTLVRLSKDADLDVSQAAKETLQEIDFYEAHAQFDDLEEETEKD